MICDRPFRARRRAAGGGGDARGFTLIEMLVVLVLVAMIGGILLAAYERILDVRIRLAAFLDGTDAPTLIAGWFRDSVGGLIPDQTGNADVFAGTRRRLAGLSVAPIDGTPGVPTRIAWELVFDQGTGRTALRYRDGNTAPLTIASWPGDRGALQYCGPKLSCSDNWPPPGQHANPADAPAQLPALVVLEAVRGTAAWPIAAAPGAAHNPLPKAGQFGQPSS